jgi:hypothetical protein
MDVHTSHFIYTWARVFCVLEAGSANLQIRFSITFSVRDGTKSNIVHSGLREQATIHFNMRDQF